MRGFAAERSGPEGDPGGVAYAEVAREQQERSAIVQKISCINRLLI